MSTPSPQRPERAPLPALSDFAHVRVDRLRLTDLDFQQHVNNAAQTALLANARFDFLGDVVRPALPAGSKLVIATLEVRFVREMRYGNEVQTGTRLLSLGRTSLQMEQAIYQDGQCAVRAVCVFVHVGADGTSQPWPPVVHSLVAPTNAARSAS